MADNSKVNPVRKSRDGRWEMFESEEKKFFGDYENEDTSLVRTPNGKIVSTVYRELAERILNDLEKLGYNYHSPESILAWHSTLIDNCLEMDHSEIEEILDHSFMQQDDWIFEENQGDEEWVTIFGEKEDRNTSIREWLSECSHMQMTAACCIGNA